MGCCRKVEHPEANEKFGKELAKGPVDDRSCTDVFCIPLFLIAQVAFVVVTIMSMQEGNPNKLYRPRDFSGAYCGVESNWNNGPNTEGAEKRGYTMNVSSTVDVMMKQLVCSSFARQVLTEGNSPLLTPEESTEYMCDCCFAPCSKCQGSEYNGGDLTAGNLQSVVTGRLTELTGVAPASDLFSPGGANGDLFSGEAFWNQATKYFNSVCLPDCDATFASVNGSESAYRNYTFVPTKDEDLYSVWMKLLNSTDTPAEIQDTMNTMFTFRALPMDICPYEDPKYCVPFPGLVFTEMADSGYCTFALGTDVTKAIGTAATSILEALAIESFTDSVTETFGTWMGDFQMTMDAFIIVCISSFVVGLVFLILLRFFLKACVWIAIAVTILSFLIGGGALFVRSGQCSGVSFSDAARQNTVAIVTTGTTLVDNLVNGEEAVSEDMAADGDGADYRGVQHYTYMGRQCVHWDANRTVLTQYTSANYNHSDLKYNFCRNPFNEGDTNKARTIWCITDNVDYIWEECVPIGTIQPECTHGYAVTSATNRQIIYYTAFVVWGMGVIWVLFIIFMFKRIELAIALNAVAATFVGQNPHIVLVPVVQAIVAIAWNVVWIYAACFLLSQVPVGYVPTDPYATYAEAYGTASSCPFWDFSPECSGVPGKCNDRWPSGGVFKGECDMVNGTAHCWYCSPPRFNIDWRFAVSFFVYLWNNAFSIALGQMLIAMAVSIWFFTVDKMTTAIVGRAVVRTFRYHIGTVAFGSFIIAVIQFVRYTMKYLEKQAAAQKNRLLVLVLKVLQCCIWCFEKCVQFLNKNAYIQVALLGTNFCTSAKKAFFLIMRNALRFGAVAMLGGGVHAIGYICIMTGTAVAGYFIVRAMHESVSPLVPVMSYIVVSYIIAKLFMNVFGLAVDTCLQCFLVCEEGQFGGDEYIPSDLQKFLKEHNKKTEAKDASYDVS